MAYPLAVAVIAGVFAVMVLRQYINGRRPHQLVWTMALLMAAMASAAYISALPPRSSQFGFHIYYALGAVLMPAWLGLGSIYLVAPRRLADAALGLLVNASALGAGAVFGARIDSAALADLNGGPGTGVLEPGPWLPLTIGLNTLGVLAVVGVAVYSSVEAARRRRPGQFVVANILIAAGDLVIGAAGSLARTGRPEFFWMTMLAGWIVIFGGFLVVQRLPARDSRPDIARRNLRQWAAPAGRTPVA